MKSVKLNIPVRLKNPWFWIGVLGTILAAMGVDPQMFTSWSLVCQAVVDLVTNPFQLACVVVAVLGIFVDPTTAGISDSKLAMTYNSPKKGD